jgi:hypothetical protein
MKKFTALLLVIWFIKSCTPGEEIRFKIEAGSYSYLECPLSISVDTMFKEIPEKIELFELQPDGSLALIPSQLDETSMESLLWFTVKGTFLKGEVREYVLKPARKSRNKPDGKTSLEETEDELLISLEGNPSLTYRKTPMLPPDNVDPIYQRSAYIHPLYSPGGTLLTNIQPPDHYHHYGIWNPWTKTYIGEREIDYWNLAKGEGTVRSRAILQTSSGPLYTSFTALHEHVDLQYSEGERTTMDEFWDIIFRMESGSSKRYQVDFTSTIRNVLQDTILFEAYRYGGGIGYRATHAWNEVNSSVLTSEGLTRVEADGTRARWCIVEGVAKNADNSSAEQPDRSGILFLSHPLNREHPEPMMVWPSDSPEGQLFFEFCPIRHKSWFIIPGNDYKLRYRMIIFDGTISPEEADMYWNSFAYPPKPEILSE